MVRRFAVMCLLFMMATPVFREEIAAAIGTGKHDEPDQLLTPKEAAVILGVSERWFYRHSKIRRAIRAHENFSL